MDFLIENVWISVEIIFQFVPVCPINNIQALVRMLAKRQPGAKP